MGKKRKTPEEEMWRKNVKHEVVFSPFITFDIDGEMIFHKSVPCPDCDGLTSGEEAGVFECPFCGWSPISKYSSSHSYYLILEHTWKLLRLFIHYKRLRWIVSELLWNIHSWLNDKYLEGRHKITITSGNYIWNRREKKWVRFI